jgi:uncharacterized membrane protein YheB (UPF0754 family)
MAIWMLFHPYEAKYIPGTRIQLPLTPGIFPRGRGDLSRSIAETVTSTLLTEQDLHKQAERLITEEALVGAIEALLESVTRELQNTEQIRQIYRYGEEVVPTILNQAVNGLIDNLESGKGGQMQTAVRGMLSQVLPGTRLNYHQAEYLTDLLFSTLLTPAYMREMIVEGLNDTNITRIEHGVSSRIGGLKGLIVRMMGMDKSLAQLRDRFRENPEAAENELTELLDKLGAREKLAERISSFSFGELPQDAQEALLQHVAGILTENLSDHRQEISESVLSLSGKGSRMLINRMLQLDLKAWLNEKRPDLKRELARFLYRYLHRELELIVSRILPVIDIGGMIVEKLDQFSNQELEQIIYGICRRELRWMAFLGAFLGFWLGLVSNLLNYGFNH